MKNNYVQEIGISVVMIALLLIFLNPFGFWMPSAMHMTMIIIFIIAFVLYAGFIWQESSRDEREGMHTMMADRASFLSGIAMLVAAIVVESLFGTLDHWIVLTLGIMILVKIAAMHYGCTKY